jgi:hypothetical protein
MQLQQQLTSQLQALMAASQSVAAGPPTLVASGPPVVSAPGGGGVAFTPSSTSSVGSGGGYGNSDAASRQALLRTWINAAGAAADGGSEGVQVLNVLNGDGSSSGATVLGLPSRTVLCLAADLGSVLGPLDVARLVQQLQLQLQQQGVLQ